MWIDFLMSTCGPGHQQAEIPPVPEAWAFGYGAELETELAELVVAGTKRATASCLEGILADGDPMPFVGAYSVILDGAATARCIIRTTGVHVAPLDSVSEEFAWREGEGDRSRDYWLAAHRDFFRREQEEAGRRFFDQLPVVFEEFTVVWPREICDTEAS
jgi:uncharacterized protein YhfF